MVGMDDEFDSVSLLKVAFHSDLFDTVSDFFQIMHLSVA